MGITTLESLGRYDTLYLSAHLDDAALSCAAALTRDRRQGRRALVATFFTEGDSTYVERRREDERALALLGADGLWAGLLDAPFRSARYRSFSGIVLDRDPADTSVSAIARAWIDEVVAKAQPRRCIGPLAVGGHIDHLLLHEACRSVRRTELWFSEDRPYALVRGQVERRLRTLGADVEPRGLRARLQTASDLARSGYVRSYLRPRDVLRAPSLRARRAERDPAEAHRWRSELVIESPDAFAAASQVLACYESQWRDLFHSLRQFERQTRRYCAHLSPIPGYVERLWMRP